MLWSKPAIKTVWLDVSLLYTINTNQPTGIPRTTIGIFRAWLDAGYTNLRLCRIDTTLGGYFEVSAESVLKRFGPGRARESLAPPPPPEPKPGEENVVAVAPPPQLLPPAIPVRRRDHPIIRVMRRLLWRLPAPVKAQLRRGINLFRGRRAAPPQAPAAESPQVPAWPEPNLTPALALGPTDLVISLGGGWIFPNSSEVCEDLQQHMGFRAAHLIYDMIPLKLPQFYPADMYPGFFGWMAPTIRYMEFAAAISEHTKRDLAEFCAQHGLKTPPTTVIRLGEGISPVPAPEYPPLTESFDPRQPFVLSVGTLEIRKNHHLLYHAWRRLIQERGDTMPRLVLIGSRGWLASDILHMINNDPLTKGQIIVIPHCDDSQLRWLYQQCLFTMYPSHYEGWGLPIAESLAFGKYCICSNSSSIPEIAPDLVGMHDPCDLLGCLDLVRQALDPKFRAAQEARIRKQFRHTPWSETARQLAEALEAHFGPTLRLPDLQAPESRLAKSA